MLASHAAIVAMPGAEILHTGELFPILVIRDSVEAAKVEEVVKPARTARPPNAWILYRKDHHKGVKAEFPEMHNNDICECFLCFFCVSPFCVSVSPSLSPSPSLSLPLLCLSLASVSPLRLIILSNPAIHISGMWHNESFEVRKRYKEMAEAHRERFHKEHPGYKYKPRKSSEVIRRAKRAVTGSIAEGRVVKVGRLTPAVQMHLETQELKAAEGVRPAFIALGTPRVPTAVEVEEQTAAEHEADEAEVAAEIAFVDEMEF